MSKYFIGIVPPVDIYNAVSAIQDCFLANKGVEPHITLKAQSGLTLDELWIDDLRHVLNNINSFEVCVRGTAYFGNEVLYIDVYSEKLIALHNKIYDVIQPSLDDKKKYFESDYYVPHITVGKTSYLSKLSNEKLSLNELHQMEEMVDIKSFETNFNVDHLWIYKYQDNTYQRYKKITLKS